ncbi:MAG TPA: hypothetical protein VGK25_11020 [Ignavibacteria bacterium]|jgi:hypothetical protein
MKYENLFKIHIPKPCNEDWKEMTPNEKGAFCSVCSKTVVDFSKKSDEEVQRYLLENNNSKVCGRFRISQVELPALKIEKPKYEFPGFLIPVLTPFRASAMALMLFASALVSSCGNSNSEEHLAGAVELVDSTSRPVNFKSANDSSTEKATGKDWSYSDKNINLTNICNDSLKTDSLTNVDSTENFIKGEIDRNEDKIMGLYIELK